MPPQALALALAASIYPPAVAAVIALGRGSQVRSRVFAFVLAATTVTYASGTLMLFVLSDLGATGPGHHTPSAALDLALGVLLIGLAARLRRKQRNPAKPGGPPPRVERTGTNQRVVHAARSPAGGARVLRSRHLPGR
jgi:hypothetical protein